MDVNNEVSTHAIANSISDNQSLNNEFDAMDIQTPTASSEGDSQRQFSDGEKQILSECEDFAYSLLHVVNDLRRQGYSDRSLGKFPKSELLEILGLSKTPKVLRGSELHEYLKTKIVSSSCGETEVSAPSNIPVESTLDFILLRLEQELLILKTINVKMLRSSLNYGRWLNAAYKIFEWNKACGKVKGSWQKWLKSKLGISDSYARQLRELASKFEGYKKIYSLSITLSEFWNRRLEIDYMLVHDVDIAEYWK